MAPDDDPFWQARLAGELTYVGYWDALAKAAGFEDWRQFFRVVTDAVPHGLFDDDALALMRDARAEGRRVGVLTNDGYLINGPEWFQSRPEFQDLDAFVDATELGVRKPAAEAYLAAAKVLDVAPERIVFLDDTPECVEGARAVGMVGLHVDPQARQPAFDRARELLGLVPPSRAARLVQAAEDAYASLDLDAVLRLFHPDCVVWWNGRKAASGLEEVRQVPQPSDSASAAPGRPTSTSPRRSGPPRATRSAWSGCPAIAGPTARRPWAGRGSSGRCEETW